MGTREQDLLTELDRFAAKVREIHADLTALVESDLVTEEWLTSDDGDYALLALKNLGLAADFLTRPV